MRFVQHLIKSHGVINDLFNVDFISSNVNSSRQEALLYVFEDNEAVIKMIIKGRSPTMRHVSRTHRVALDWLFDRINLDPKIQIRYIDTKNQFADILIKGNFARDEWNYPLCLFNIGHFSSANCSEVMSKRTQKNSGEERVTSKSKQLVSMTLQNDDVQDFDVRALLSVSEMPSDPILEGLYKSKLQNSGQLRTVMALSDQEVARNNGTPNYQQLKTAVKLQIDQMMRNRNFEARNDVVERGSVTKSQKQRLC